MKKLLATNPGNTTALFARLALGVVVFPHGAQKLLGWFGGYGFDGTMGFLTGSAGLPSVVALLVILIEFFGALFLIAGFATRLAAIAILGNFIGVVITSNLHNGFFMNWYAQANKGEGLEYFILLFGLLLVSVIAGGGRASVDAAIMKGLRIRERPSKTIIA
ncbi:MAG: DoxX family protein [Bacteroidota bacterium]